MKYKIRLQHSEEGVAASVLGLPGCHSQGADEVEAMENVEVAIKEYLEVQERLWDKEDVREVEVEA